MKNKKFKQKSVKPQIRKQMRKIKAIKIWFFKKKISTQAKGKKK